MSERDPHHRADPEARLDEIAHPDSWMNGRWQEGRPGLPPLERRKLWRTKLERSPFRNIDPETVDQHAAAQPVPAQVQAAFEEVNADCLTEGTDHVCHMLWLHPGLKRWVRLVRGPNEREWTVWRIYSSRCFDEYAKSFELIDVEIPSDWDARTVQLYGHLSNDVGEFRVPTKEDFVWDRQWDLRRDHEDMPNLACAADQVEHRLYEQEKQRGRDYECEDEARAHDMVTHYDYVIQEALNDGIEHKFVQVDLGHDSNFEREVEAKHFYVEQKRGYKVRRRRKKVDDALVAHELAKLEAERLERAAARAQAEDDVDRHAFRAVVGMPPLIPSIRDELVHELDQRPASKAESPEERARRLKSEAIRKRREAML